MPTDPLIQEVVSEFRSVVLQRLSRIESSWHLVVSSQDSALGIEIEREVHNMKGEARLVGFHDVAMLCHKLEDMLRFGRSRDYRVPESIDLLAVTVVGFIRLLVHKSAGQPMAGLDLAEFSRQVDAALREAYLAPEPLSEVSLSSDRSATTTLPTVSAAGQVSHESLLRLAAAATSVYLQHLTVEGAARASLRQIWLKLAQEIRRIRSISVATMLSRQSGAARDLASSLHKKVDFQLQAGSASVGLTLGPVIDLAVTHAVTNAIDHGIETPRKRREGGKPEIGLVKVSAESQGTEIEVVVEDDGAGVDLAAVAKRAADLGLLPTDAPRVSREQLLALLMQPRFSTRTAASETSGRGVGLDAVRTAVTRHGGQMQLSSEDRQGTRVVVRLPQDRQELGVHHFLSVSGGIRFAVSRDWVARVRAASDEAIDPVRVLGLPIRNDPSRSSEPVSLELSRGGKTLSLSITGGVSDAPAERLCPTSSQDSVEVVLLDEGEALLLNPWELARRAGAAT